MSIVSSPGSHGIPGVPPFPIYPTSVAKYHEMIEKGILTENDPVELLEGWIVPKMARTPAHDVAIGLSESAIRPKLPPGWRLRVQCAVTTRDSEPEPDLAVVAGDVRAFLTRQPGPAEVGLLIEAAESSITTDRVDKGRIYARANIPAYWIINLVDRQVEVYRDPIPQGMPPAYHQREVFVRGQSIPLILMNQTIAQIPVDELLP